jgi:hypothetical protein
MLVRHLNTSWMNGGLIPSILPTARETAGRTEEINERTRERTAEGTPSDLPTLLSQGPAAGLADRKVERRSKVWNKAQFGESVIVGNSRSPRGLGLTEFSP